MTKHVLCETLMILKIGTIPNKMGFTYLNYPKTPWSQLGVLYVGVESARTLILQTPLFCALFKVLNCFILI